MDIEYDDPKWITSLAKSIKLIDKNLTDEEMSFIRDLFMDYRHDGLDSRKALEKAVQVFNLFKNKRKVTKS